jgi:hypothetical protein
MTEPVHNKKQKKMMPNLVTFSELRPDSRIFQHQPRTRKPRLVNNSRKNQPFQPLEICKFYLKHKKGSFSKQPFKGAFPLPINMVVSSLFEMKAG